MNIAVIGATGLVGQTIIEVLRASKLNITELLPVASEKSEGKEIEFKGKSYKIITVQAALALKPDIAFFAAGGAVSLQWVEQFANSGTYVIDNSSTYRMSPNVKLVVPEVNASVLTKEDKIIANPNCSTIQMVVVLKPLMDQYGLRRVVVSTYQSVTGSGQKGIQHLMEERKGSTAHSFYPHNIDMNLIPQIDAFDVDDYTKEELKMINETRKILSNPQLKVTATTVRVPVKGGHSESVNIELNSPFELNSLKVLLENSPGIILQDDPKNSVYPMPKNIEGRDEVFVGRIRRDNSQENTLNCWIVADNLRKGAATNSVQIAEYLQEKNWI